MNSSRMADIAQQFFDRFGRQGETLRFFAAPGRVNLIGEHIDYCGGAVLPAALTLDHIVAARPIPGRTVRLAATDLSGIVEIDLDNIEAARSLKWGNYQAGMIKALTEDGFSFCGAELLFDGTIPYGSGLSSSASIELVTGIAMISLSGNPVDSKIPLALAGQRTENTFCGVNCGIMDQFASAMGKKDHAIHLICSTLEYQYVPLVLGDYKLVLANTCKKHSLGASKYNERRQEVEQGLHMLQKMIPDYSKEHLCDYSALDYYEMQDIIEESAVKNRIKHVILENARVKKAVKLLKSGDLKGFGEVMKQAHASTRDLYEVTGLELDTMFEEACKIDGCIGARMTGGGFGGCTVNIVHQDTIPAFCEQVGAAYQQKTGIIPKFYTCEIGEGAREL